MKLAMLFGLALCISAQAQDRTESKSTAEAAIASGPVTVCVSNEPGSDCEKRDLARMLLIAGKREAALRVLCSTLAARVAFGDEAKGIPSKCLQAVDIEVRK